MDILRDAIVDTLQGRFPDMADRIKPFGALMTEQADGQLSYPSPAILVCTINCVEAPEAIAPWELRANMGLVITAKAPSAIERDKQGWRLAMRVASVVYRNTWGLNPGELRPAIITSIQKNDARDPTGTPTGVSYWTITFYQWLKFDLFL